MKSVKGLDFMEIAANIEFSHFQSVTDSVNCMQFD